MKRSLKKLNGLPGGANEKIFSNDGYRSTSSDVNNPYNIIPSGSITMKEKNGSPLRKGPLMGTDNLGNSQIMYPGADYQFPGNMVTETPLAKKGGAFQNSNIYATNKLFAVNKLFKKRKKSKKAKGIYNPKAKYTYQPGGSVDLPEDVGIGYLPDEERSYYNPLIDTVYLNPNASEEEFNHEMAHAWQNRQDGFRSDPYSPKLRPSAAASDEQAATYFNRKGDDVDRYLGNLKTIAPELGGHTWNEDLDRFMPDQLKYDKVVDPLMYSDPSTLEGEAEYMSQVYGRPPLGIKQDGGEMEIEIDEEDINKYVKGGYIVEELDDYAEGGALLTKKVTCKKCGWTWDAADGGNDLTTCHKCGGQGLIHAQNGGNINDISIPTLTRMQPGGPVPESTYTPIDPNFLAANPDTYSQIVNKPEVTSERQASDIGKLRSEYRDKNPMDKFLDEKKRQYLKKNKGLNKAAGVTMENFPDVVLQNFTNEYNYKTNNYAVNKLGKKEGWNPKRRGEWVDELTPGEKDAVAESKYGSKLQPSYWSRSLAGVQELGNAAIKLLPGEQGDVLKYNIPGLTKKEQKEIAESKIGALETLAPMDIPGAAIANLVKNTGLSTGSDYKEQANALAGEKMANVSDMEAMAFNPLTYAGLEALPELGVNLVRGAGRGISAIPETIDVIKSHPSSWFQTSEERLSNPNVWKSLNEEASWKDPLGKYYNWNDTRKLKKAANTEQKLIDAGPFGDSKYVKEVRELLGNKSYDNVLTDIEKLSDERALKRSRLPIKPVLNSKGSNLGGGQGRIYLNLNNPDEVIKLGVMPGEKGVMQNLVDAGNKLKQENVAGLENVALPNKAISINSGQGHEFGAQFMPLLKEPLDPINPIVKDTDGFLRSGSIDAKEKLLETVKKLDSENIGIDYVGQGNIFYDPTTDSYKLVDLNYTSGSGKPRFWNELDKPVKERLAGKIGNWNSDNVTMVPQESIDLAKRMGALPENFSGELSVDEFVNLLKNKNDGFIKQEVPAFKSEINWRDWVKYKEDFDNNPNVIQELNDIEKSSKEAGTWMKNADGTPFQGTPEQFVVQQSTNWKNAFPEYYGETLTTRSNNQFDTFDESKFGATDEGWYGKGIYAYPTQEAKQKGIGTMYGSNEYDLYVNSANKGIVNDADPISVGAAEMYQKNINELVSNLKTSNDEFIKKYGSNDLTERLVKQSYDDLFRKVNAAEEKNINQYTTLTVPSSANETVIPFSNTVKSAKGNILFDMTNPNMYKAMLPYIIPAGLGVGAASQMQGQESNANFKDGGIVSDLSKKEIDELVKKGFIVEEIY